MEFYSQMFNVSKILSVLYLLTIAAALFIYVLKPNNKTKPSLLIAVYLLIFLVTELLTTFLLPRNQPNHYVYAWSFLFTGIILSFLYTGIINSKLIATLFVLAVLGYILFFVKERLWLSATILKVEWIANCHFLFAVGALSSLWYAIQASNVTSAKFVQRVTAVLVVYHTVAIINISTMFSVKLIQNNATFQYFYWLFETINLIFLCYLSAQLILFRNKTAAL